MLLCRVENGDNMVWRAKTVESYNKARQAESSRREEETYVHDWDQNMQQKSLVHAQVCTY